jgi:ribonucleoside-diphosphate reductase subunit M2
MSSELVGLFAKKKDLTRLAFLPIENPALEKYYQEQKNVFWTTQEISFVGDREQFETLDENTKKYVKPIIFLFAQLDGIVNENLVSRFKAETSELAKECSMVYAIFEAMEWGHNETYSAIIKVYIRDPEEQRRGLNAIANFPAIRKIADWAFQWMESTAPLQERIVAFACIEGIIFSSAFAGIYWLKRRNILPGLCKANEWIARDEAIHTRFAVALYHHMTKIWSPWRGGVNPLPKERIHAIISSAVEVTELFTRDAMNVDLVGIDADDMVTYIKCTADSLSSSLGYPTIYGVVNPFDWMAIISLPNKTNFFESRVTEYAREGAQGNDDFVFDLDVDM